MGGGGGPTIIKVRVSDDSLKKAVAYCLDDGNCNGSVAGDQDNGYINDAKVCGYLDKTARKLIAHAGCENFENKNIKGESFTSFIHNLEKKEEIEEIEKQKKDGENRKRRKFK